MRLISQKGIALLMILWIMTILMVIAMSFSSMTKTETYSTLSFKEGAEKRFLAEAGIERAIMELFYRIQNIGMMVTFEGSELWKIDGTLYKGQLGDGNYSVRIMDESGKIDINIITDANSDILRNLLKNLEIPEDDANTIVDCILDWKDADDLLHLNGAEDDYYMSLPNPYKTKNANFDTLEELLLVKGITQEILYGDKERRGLIEFITINSNRSQININAAPKEVLMALPGMTPEIADAIIDYRGEKEILNIAEVQPILGANYSLISRYISAGSSNTFSIDSVGYKENEKAGFGIKSIVIIEGNNQYRYIYYKSPAIIKKWQQ
ncbi:MAG: general secretion pathway protein GspK [Nitrospirae bacterium]|nr:general secretion pathway protein GspK [Nitrospirota bacterium]